MAPPKGGVRTSLRFQVSGSWPGYTQGGAFSPGVPLEPLGQEPVRVWDFPVNVNANPRPRAYSPVTFHNLRAFANVEQVRLAIETRKDQIERLTWKVKPIDEKAARKNLEQVTPRIAEVEKFWRRPDGVRPFRRWLRRSLEDLLVLDAPAFQMLRTRGGGPKGVGKLRGLEVIFGDSITPLVDETGRRPTGVSDVAFQQYLPGKGVVWADLRNQDLLYVPRNERPNHEYGYGPVEQIIVTINTLIRRQAAQLAYFTEGNVPAGLLNAPEGWQPQQIKEIQEWMDSKMSGLTAEQVKLLWVPAGTKYQSFKDSPLKDDFDEWLARVVAYCFSLPPTPFIRQMNKGTAGEDQERSLEEGLEPLKLWWKEIADQIIQEELGHADLEWAWNDTAEIDRVQQAEMDDKALRNGSTTIDEVRDRRGEEPLPDGLGSRPMVYTGTGPVLLEEVIQAFDEPTPELAPVIAPPSAGAPPRPVDGQAEPAEPAPKPTPSKPVEKLAKRAAKRSIAANRPKARRAAASLQRKIAPILQRAGDHVGAEIASKLKQLGKAADDGEIAKKLAAQVDLSTLDDLAEAAHDELLDIVLDSGKLALASVHVGATDELVDQINQAAIDYAKQRAAEMVSVDGEKNLIDSTRATIRDVIVQGLEDNIGADAIAEAVQESTAFSAERAELIAKTEIAMANGAGKFNGWKAAESTGVELQKFWQTSNNDNCCDDCQANEDASPVPLGESFPSGDDSEPAHPNCQCVTYAEPVSDSSEADAEDDTDDE